MDVIDVIEKLGGTSEVARLCEIEPPSVSEWKRNGIPKARLMYLRAIRPDIFADGQKLGTSATVREAA